MERTPDVVAVPLNEESLSLDVYQPNLKSEQIRPLAESARCVRLSLPSEPQSDESTDTKVQLPPNARVDPDSDAVADQRPYASSGGERTLA